MAEAEEPWSLIDLGEAIYRLGLEDNPDVRHALTGALRAAQVKFEGLYDSPFTAQTDRTDTFFLNSKRHPQAIDGFYRCRLSQAFVWPEQAVTVSNALNFEGNENDPFYAVDSAPFYGWSIINGYLSIQVTGGSKFASEKGILYVPETYSDQYVTIAYSAGFDVDHPPPTWLQEAILAYLPWVLNSQQVTNRSQEQEGQVVKVKDLSGDMVAPYMRGRAFQLYPMFK